MTHDSWLVQLAKRWLWLRPAPSVGNEAVAMPHEVWTINSLLISRLIHYEFIQATGRSSYFSIRRFGNSAKIKTFGMGWRFLESKITNQFSLFKFLQLSWKYQMSISWFLKIMIPYSRFSRSDTTDIKDFRHPSSPHFRCLIFWSCFFFKRIRISSCIPRSNAAEPNSETRVPKVRWHFQYSEKSWKSGAPGFQSVKIGSD